MKRPCYNQEQRMLMRSDTSFAGAGLRAAFAIDQFNKAIDLLPKRKPPPLWLRQLFS